MIEEDLVFLIIELSQGTRGNYLGFWQHVLNIPVSLHMQYSA